MIATMTTTIHFQSPSGRPARLGRDRTGKLEVVVDGTEVNGVEFEQVPLNDLVREYGCDNLREAYRMLKTYAGVR